MISLEKLKNLKPLQKLPKNVGDLGKLTVNKGFKMFPNSNKLPNLVTPIINLLRAFKSNSLSLCCKLSLRARLPRSLSIRKVVLAQRQS